MDVLEGRTAVVTGAAGGIGLALSRAFAGRGMRVVLADRDAVALEQAAVELSATGATVRAVPTDVADPASVDALAAAASNAFGAIHLLANNAGILRPGSTFDQPIEDWHAVLGVNVLGIVHGLRSFVPAMLAHGEPCHVLNVASIGGLIASPHMAAYIASKHAAVAISECLALEVTDSAMGVTVLCPGGVATGIYRAEAERRAAVGLSAASATEAVFERMAADDRADQASPQHIADAALDAVLAGRLYAVVNAGDHIAAVRERHLQIEHAMGAAPRT